MTNIAQETEKRNSLLVAVNRLEALLREMSFFEDAERDDAQLEEWLRNREIWEPRVSQKRAEE